MQPSYASIRKRWWPQIHLDRSCTCTVSEVLPQPCWGEKWAPLVLGNSTLPDIKKPHCLRDSTGPGCKTRSDCEAGRALDFSNRPPLPRWTFLVCVSPLQFWKQGARGVIDVVLEKKQEGIFRWKCFLINAHGQSLTPTLIPMLRVRGRIYPIVGLTLSYPLEWNNNSCSSSYPIHQWTYSLEFRYRWKSGTPSYVSCQISNCYLDTIVEIKYSIWKSIKQIFWRKFLKILCNQRYLLFRC